MCLISSANDVANRNLINIYWCIANNIIGRVNNGLDNDKNDLIKKLYQLCFLLIVCIHERT